MKKNNLGSSYFLLTVLVFFAAVFIFSACKKHDNDNFPAVNLPRGYNLEKVVDGLNFPTSLTWDEDKNMYVVEAGGGFLPEPSPARILKVSKGRADEIVNLSNKNVVAPVVGLTYYNNAFYITHRADDQTGAVSRVSKDGSAINQILSGFLDGGSEHPLNSVQMGPDGRMYLCVGPAGNSAVMGPDIAPFINRKPSLHTTSAKDLVLLGKNFKSEDFRTKLKTDDSVLTGAYMPFGTPSTPGQIIPGTNKPGGSIVSFDPANAEGTLETVAYGLRNVIGVTWNKEGEMFAAVNGYDVRGSRPVKDLFDATFLIKKGTWYGYPDYSLTGEPLTDPTFDSDDKLQAEVFVNGVSQGKNLGFVIDHAASGLTAPDKNLIVGLHPFHSSPSLLDVAPNGWGVYTGHLFVAEWGDLTPPTDPAITRVGYRIVEINPHTKQVVPFLSNVSGLPGSEQGKAGKVLERPFDVKFGPDGAMYIVDYGQVKINLARKAQDREPYEYIPGTGVIWKVTKE
jgi:glucose/arabinose dehydrogenase